MNPTTTINQMKWRAAIKKYNPEKKLTTDQLNLVKESLRLSPSSFGLEAWNFIHVTNPETRKKLRAAGYDQSQITDASELFILAPKVSIDAAYVETFISDVAASRNIPVESLDGYKKSLMGAVARPADLLTIWLAHQIYIPLGVAIANLAQNNIDASPMEGFDANAFDEILGLKEHNLHAQVILTVGFRADDDTYSQMPKFREPTERVFIEK